MFDSSERAESTTALYKFSIFSSSVGRFLCQISSEFNVGCARQSPRCHQCNMQQQQQQQKAVVDVVVVVVQALLLRRMCLCSIDGPCAWLAADQQS